MRDEVLVKIRPEVVFVREGMTAEESFQNITLRPILKLQNELILTWFKNALQKSHPRFNVFNNAEQKRIIRTMLKMDTTVKAFLINSIVAFFTLTEMGFYYENKTAINKRITELLIKRIEDQQEQLL